MFVAEHSEACIHTATCTDLPQIPLNIATSKIISSFLYLSMGWFSLVAHFHKQRVHANMFMCIFIQRLSENVLEKAGQIWFC